MRREVLGVCFDKTGKKLVSCSADRTIRIWDPTTGEPIGSPLTGHTGEVNCVGFDPTGKKLVSCSDDRTVRIWSVGSSGTFECESTLAGHSDW